MPGKNKSSHFPATFSMPVASGMYYARRIVGPFLSMDFFVLDFHISRFFFRDFFFNFQIFLLFFPKIGMLNVSDILPNVTFPKLGIISCFPC